MKFNITHYVTFQLPVLLPSNRTRNVSGLDSNELQEMEMKKKKLNFKSIV
jgi:hypothetical protein